MQLNALEAKNFLIIVGKTDNFKVMLKYRSSSVIQYGWIMEHFFSD